MGALVDFIMVTTACKPSVDRDGKQSSIVYRAGQKYKGELTDELKLWLERGNAYLADQPAPKEPPKTDPFITSARTDQDLNLVREIVERTVERMLGLSPPEQEKLRKAKGWNKKEE